MDLLLPRSQKEKGRDNENKSFFFFFPQNNQDDMQSDKLKRIFDVSSSKEAGFLPKVQIAPVLSYPQQESVFFWPLSQQHSNGDRLLKALRTIMEERKKNNHNY